MWQALAVRDFRLLWASEAVSSSATSSTSWRCRGWSSTSPGPASPWAPCSSRRRPAGAHAAAVRRPRRPPAAADPDARRPPRPRGVVVGAMAALVLSGRDVAAAARRCSGPCSACSTRSTCRPSRRSCRGPLEAERLPSANSLLQGTLQLTSIVGPPLAGAFIVVVGIGDRVRHRRRLVLPRGRGRPPDLERRRGHGGDRRRQATATTRTGRAGRPPGTPSAPLEEAQPSFLTAIRDGIRYVLADSPLAMTLLLSMILNFALNGPGRWSGCRGSRRSGSTPGRRASAC